ncbi:TOS1 [Pyrenophora tritici-repentis]|uniref:glucan endo-1,3-beta-D-glucosidase n=1 Tax=Pyrenophora tritici-repentis TaxID=45151 RepID=A0A922T198_9PLEO|nr:TOS1 [Pyrenophora tritici-repentis]KAI1664458.1 TOS1 [Pyrenophora tritici-repentis]KAI1678566.1 TOS1 [Pyrenophora tritici-repentis]
MKHTILSAVLLLPLAYSKTSRQLCGAITYHNISQPGAYNRTVVVDPRTGICNHERVKYPSVGPLAPLFGQVSMHLRGPMNVSQLAVYLLPSEAHFLRKRTTVPFYNHHRAIEKRECLGVAINKTTPTSSKPDCPCNEDNDKDDEHDPVFERPNGQTFVIPKPSPIKATVPVEKRQGSNWSRVAYYTSASPAKATGISFQANLGDPAKSGTAFGNSLSYVNSQGTTVAAQSLPFNGKILTSEYEIIVFSNKACDGNCPYWRPNATAHYGWSGSSKAFFIEFQMDHYPNRGTDQGLLSDAPAYWFLNAAIPRVLQYGNDRNNIPCSCWSTGCGEFDAFELLSKGAERAKSTMHRQGNLEGGDSNYFKRPIGKTMKFAVVWHYPHITAMVLDDRFDFSESMTDDAIKKLVAYDPDSWTHSLFPIGK